MLFDRAGIALLVVTAFASSPALAVGGGDDSCATAVTIGPGLVGPTWTEESYDDLHPSWNWVDYDWYRVVVPPGHQLRATLTRLAATGTQATLISSFRRGPCPGVQLDSAWLSSASETDVFTASNATGQPVEHYVLVHAFVFTEGYGQIQYSLDVELVPPSPGCSNPTEDGFEVGPGVRVPIAPGTYSSLYASSANDDEYTLRIPFGATIRVAIDFAHAQGDLDLEVRDATMTLVSNGLTNQESVVYAPQTPAAFHDVVVRVAPKSAPTATCNHYALSIDVLQQALGTTYCQAGINGYGTGARILSAGTSSVSANDLSFVCQAFPATNAGVLIGSTTPAQVAFGDGFRCVGGSIFRFGPSSATAGVATYAANFASGSGLAVTAGTIWNFQVFYRDQTLPGGAGFNLSDAVSIAMTP